MSDTPRTDDKRRVAEALRWNEECVWEWAGQLERENTALRESLRGRLCSNCGKVEPTLDGFAPDGYDLIPPPSEGGES